MSLTAGLFLLAIAVFHVSSGHIQPEFIEDVIKRESESPVSRIVSGWEAVPGQHPHQAALRQVDAGGGVSACGGSFVHREWVITAAHCTALRVTVVVRGGVVSLTTPEYIYETTEWWNHPSFNDNLPSVVQPNDISIVKLQRPVTYTRNLKAIRIQPSLEAFNNYDEQVLYTSGHGRTWTDGATTEVLRWVYLRGVSNPSCASTFGTTLINSNAICARWFNVTSQSTCQGDSGGPLVHVNSDGVPILIGVTSFVAGGQFGCHSGLPAGFIRPGPFLSWLEDITGIDFENLDEDDDNITTTPQPESEEDITETSRPPETPSTTTEAPQTTTEIPAPPEGGSEEEDTSEEESGSNEDETSCESSESESGDNESELLKRLQVKVRVKVILNKFKVKKHVHKERQKKRH